MEERSQTSSSGGTCKTGSLFSTHSNEMTSHRECTTHEGPVVSQSHREWTAFQGPVVYTGPNGIRDHKVSVSRDYQMVGSGDRSPEITSQMSYLSRPPPGAKFPKAKNGQVGEIGWLYETFRIVKGI